MDDQSEIYGSCPICLDELDPTDQSFKPCRCGYQMCRFCWNDINENQNGRCPACRQPYRSENYQFSTMLSPEETGRSPKKPSFNPDRDKKPPDPNSRKHLTNIRVIQRNLVYVTNLALSAAKEETLRKPEYFGKFGKITKTIINRNNIYSGPQGPSVSAYVTYLQNRDAYSAIKATDGTVKDGRLLRASFGTTKYCTYFLRNARCPNPDCMYLHDIGRDIDSFTKQDMAQGKHLLVNMTNITPDGELIVPKQELVEKNLHHNEVNSKHKAWNAVVSDQGSDSTLRTSGGPLHSSGGIPLHSSAGIPIHNPNSGSSLHTSGGAPLPPHEWQMSPTSPGTSPQKHSNNHITRGRQGQPPPQYKLYMQPEDDFSSDEIRPSSPPHNGFSSSKSSHSSQNPYNNHISANNNNHNYQNSHSPQKQLLQRPQQNFQVKATPSQPQKPPTPPQTIQQPLVLPSTVPVPPPQHPPIGGGPREGSGFHSKSNKEEHQGPTALSNNHNVLADFATSQQNQNLQLADWIRILKPEELLGSESLTKEEAKKHCPLKLSTTTRSRFLFAQPEDNQGPDVTDKIHF